MIVEPNDLLQKLKDLKRSCSARKGVSTGFMTLDDHMLLSKQYLMVLTGMPSCGKSEILDGIAINTAILHDWSWLYFSPENFPLEEHFKKLAEKKSGRPLGSISDSELSIIAEWMQTHFAWVNPPEDKFSLDGILQITEARIQAGYPVDVLVIDPWNELDHSGQAGMRDDQYISKCLTTLRRFHRKYDLLSCVIIHPTKMQKDHTGNYPVPSLYDCNGGAMWRNKADFGVCVHRQDMTKNEADVVVQKVKFKSMGKVGKITLDYDFKSGRFKDQYASEFLLPMSGENPY
jgi:twinkle protein